ncbi:Malate-2H(+)/Na(+)-lactate antiporter, partial [Haemophilus influenzae]
HFVAFFYFY